MPPPTALPPSGFFCWLVGPWFPQHQLQDWNPTNSGHPSRHPRSVPVVWRQIWRWVAKKPKCLGRNSYFKWGLNNAYRFRRVCWSYLKATFDVTVPSLLLRVHLFTQTLVVAGALCGRTHGMDVTIKGILRIHPAAVPPLLAHSWQANREDTTKTLMTWHPDESHSWGCFCWSGVGTNPGPWTVKTAIQGMNAVLCKTPLPGCQLSLIFIVNRVDQV